jgi:hypothetical protein
VDGIHDLGGREGFGRIRYTLNAPAFHEKWERRANALRVLAVKLGIFNMSDPLRNFEASAFRPLRRTSESLPGGNDRSRP